MEEVRTTACPLAGSVLSTGPSLQWACPIVAILLRESRANGPMRLCRSKPVYESMVNAGIRASVQGECGSTVKETEVKPQSQHMSLSKKDMLGKRHVV